MTRAPQLILIGALLGFSWLAMQAVHELGHVLGALATGGHITHVALYPTTISRTDVYPNPHPLAVVWAGPIVGTVLPLLLFALHRASHVPGVYLSRFFAGFCLITNGVYIGAGWSEHLREAIAADALVMVMHGSPPFTLALFGAVTIPLGLLLWHRQGVHFGLGHRQGVVQTSAVMVSGCLFLGVVLLELVVGSR